MTDALLCLILLCSRGQIDASFEWSRLASEYDLPAPSLSIVDQGPDVAGSTGGFDTQGRAVVTLSPRLRGISLRETVAHEAFHVGLRYAGIPYDGLREENLANTFSFCWTGAPVGYFPVRPCGEVLHLLPGR